MLEAGTMLLFCAVLFASVALGWSIIPALFVGVLLFMGYGWFAGARCARWRAVRPAAYGPRGPWWWLRAHRRTDLAVAGQRDHRLHRGPFDRGDSRRHGDSAVVSTVLGDVGAGRVVVRQCGDYGHHLHVVGIVDAGEPGDARWRDSCGRYVAIVVRRFPPVPCWSNSLRIRTCSILLPACCARVRCRLC